MNSDPAITVRGRVVGIDGVRGYATLAVTFAHLGFLHQIGWVGLQVFFVMSGFLITRVLLDLKQRSTVGRFFASFYTFRLLRIVPAYYAYLILLIVGSLLFAPEFLDEIRGQLKYLFLFVYNYAWLFEPPLRTPWLGHLWSMSVEEQFYIVWPLVIWLTPLRRLPWVALAIVLAGPATRLLMGALLEPHAARLGAPAAAAVWIVTPSHMDAFALGALLCFDRVRQAFAAIPVWAYLCSVLVAIAFGLAWNIAAVGFSKPLLLSLGYPVMLPNGGQWVWGYSIVNLVMAILLAKVAETEFIAGAARWPLMERLGHSSYSFYLVHHGMIVLFAMALTPPIIALTGAPTLGATLIWTPLYLVVMYAIGVVAFDKLETPFLRLKSRLFPSERHAPPARQPEP